MLLCVNGKKRNIKMDSRFRGNDGSLDVFGPQLFLASEPSRAKVLDCLHDLPSVLAGG